MKKKSIIILISFTFFILVLSIKSYAGYQNFESIDYDVTLNSDSSMDVIETWNIYISGTNTLFKDFELDSSKYSGITNVKVARIDNNEEVYLEQIFQEEYHVPEGCYYGLENNNNQFEIAWNVGLDSSSDTRKYKIYYTVEDAVKIYNDCTELYWQFLGVKNGISSKKITGTIKLPKPVSDIEKLRVWAHGPLKGEINRASADTVSFNLPEIPTKTMLEVRVVKEEKKWADSANFERNKPQMYYAILIIIAVIVSIYMLIKIVRNIKLRNLFVEKHKMNVEPIEYFREIPNEKVSTPARAMYLYTFKRNKPDMDRYEDNILTAVLLELSLKKVIRFENDENGEIKIVFGEIEEEQLIGEEYNVYDFLVSACNYIDNKREYITIKEFSDYAEQHYKLFHKLLCDLEYSASAYHSGFMNIDLNKQLDCKEVDKKISKISSVNRWSFLFAFIFMIGASSEGEIKKYFLVIAIIFWIIIFGNIICVRILKNALKKMSGLTEKGLREKNEWKALKKYMQDYSLLNEKTLPDIVLWEKFLVYATAFGISEEVTEQLKIAHPDMFNVNNVDNYSYWNLVSSSRNRSGFLNDLSNKIENTYRNSERKYRSEMIANSRCYSSSSHSSSSGSGGGFSSGGGGRRTAEVAAVEDKINIRRKHENKKHNYFFNIIFCISTFNI